MAAKSRASHRHIGIRGRAMQWKKYQKGIADKKDRI